jgi:hypothetical protein
MLVNTEGYASGVFSVKPVILLGTEGAVMAAPDAL